MSRYVTECKINWDFLEAEFESQVSQMKACPQDPKFHEEGDVWTHLKMVMANLEASSEWATLNHEDQEILVLSTFLHDVGKPAKWINLFYRYHASTKVVYLEPSWNDIVKQNKCRQHPVPEHIICDLFTKVNLPDLTESHKLEMRI